MDILLMLVVGMIVVMVNTVTVYSIRRSVIIQRSSVWLPL